LREQLWGPAPALESGHVERRLLLDTRRASRTTPGLEAEIYNGKRGNNPVTMFRDNRLLTTQLVTRVVGKNKADRAVLEAAEAVTSALRGVFHLDPIPHMMRDYSSERDTELRRSGENISAAVANLMASDRPLFQRVSLMVAQVADQRITDITVERSPLGDLMLVLQEGSNSSSDVTPAREMSDGLLRFIAIVTALLTSDRGLDIDPGLSSRDIRAGVLLVIEEIENGLHPSQAGRLLDLIEETASAKDTKILLTTHSPALLNAMTGILNKSIVACYRDEDTGRSRLARLPDLPGYAEALAGGDLGDAVSRGQLVRPADGEQDLTQFRRLIGLD
jgi:hypothetical protein